MISDIKNRNIIYGGRGALFEGNDYTKLINELEKSILLKKGESEVRIKFEKPTADNPYIYFLTPKRLGEATAGVSGIDGGFMLIKEGIVLNYEPYNDIEFDLYRSANALHGEMYIQIRYFELK